MVKSATIHKSKYADLSGNYCNNEYFSYIQWLICGYSYWMTDYNYTTCPVNGLSANLQKFVLRIALSYSHEYNI